MREHPSLVLRKPGGARSFFLFSRTVTVKSVILPERLTLSFSVLPSKDPLRPTSEKSFPYPGGPGAAPLFGLRLEPPNCFAFRFFPSTSDNPGLLRNPTFFPPPKDQVPSDFLAGAASPFSNFSGFF